MSPAREPVMKPIASTLLTARGGLCLLGVGLVLGLSGCSGEEVARAFGLKRSTPDEYTIITRAPLSMPPSEKLVLPGAEEANRPDESPRLQALETLAPETALHPATGTDSSGQTELVSQVSSAAKAPTNSNAELGPADQGFVDSLMFWQGGGSAGGVVDGEAENRRIQRNSALGKPLDMGATPTMRKK
ncbi:DUF3035 domain-containing protein [Oecophyllibacter saccharovorans]|uniref:DUF3035 domain-containing protein n=1 Tax=Oecophyllibacter saccharovorans TaxID=2558360 RepID=UPI001144A1B3|nr:DUF3035 domain-containing protein [Oecophyllibacter saccharovorans]TPW36295.1 DUF3035 domain-containing protein [Oecophyllibacter saccharovorans]